MKPNQSQIVYVDIPHLVCMLTWVQNKILTQKKYLFVKNFSWWKKLLKILDVSNNKQLAARCLFAASKKFKFQTIKKKKNTNEGLIIR